jgi:hypothetical protein
MKLSTNVLKFGKKFSILSFAILLLSSCFNTGYTLPSVSGSQYEILVVMEDSLWKLPAGRSLVDLLNSDMEDLPQAEPVMDVHQCTNAEFTGVLKPSRNLLITEISNKYTTPKITYGKDRWAAPQAIVRIVAPNDSSFAATIKQYGKNVLDYYIKMERERQIAFNKDYINENSKAEVEKLFGIQIDLPQGISKATIKKDFYWLTNDQAGVNQNIIIYSYPYTDKKTFSKEFLIAKRDSVMKANIPGEIEGSYMGTELKWAHPTFNEIWVNKGYCAELRGLWRMKNGAAMGGPFYSHTRLDEINQRVITMEVFVFAPGSKKRNPIRQLEAVLFSAKLPQEINAIDEVSVVADKKK